MNDTPDPPRIFANRVVKQMIAHMLSEDILVEPRDYIAIRTAFRWGGGSWDHIGEGDILHLGFLQRIISAWGALPGRRHESQEII